MARAVQVRAWSAPAVTDSAGESCCPPTPSSFSSSEKTGIPAREGFTTWQDLGHQDVPGVCAEPRLLRREPRVCSGFPLILGFASPGPRVRAKQTRELQLTPTDMQNEQDQDGGVVGFCSIRQPVLLKHAQHTWLCSRTFSCRTPFMSRTTTEVECTYAYLTDAKTG